ncbi:MAG: hypothetical protein RL518_2331 [Pseudomonadota bacterium]
MSFVYQPPRVIGTRQAKDDASEWACIRAELQTKLPGEIIEIESKRIRIEAVIAQLDTGSALRHLTITAMTPAQKEIVRYELDTLGSAPLASELASGLSRAKKANRDAEAVVRSIAQCLKRHGPYLMRKVTSEPNPWVQRCMERSVPDFEKFARNPLSIDMTFTLDHTVKSARLQAVATLMPKRRYTLVQAFSFPNGTSSIPLSRAFKVRCPAEFWQKNHTRSEIVTALHVATLDAMKTIIAKGPDRAALTFRNEDLDTRLEKGEIDPEKCPVSYNFKNGARIMLEEGDAIACIRIEASQLEESASAFWRIISPLGPLLPDNPRLINSRRAVKNLVVGDPWQKLDAIKTLDRMANADTDRLSPYGRRIPPFSALPIESLLGPSLTRALKRLPRCTVRPLPPTSEYAILDLLDGFQSVYLSHRDPAHKRMHPQDPDCLTFGFRADGALKITLRNALRNYLDVAVKPQYFNEHEGRDQCVVRLGRLFNQQTRESFTMLRREIEKLEVFAVRSVVASQALRPPSAKLPSTTNIPLNQALDTAAELALLFEADASASISDIQIVSQDHKACVMSLANTHANPPVQMHLQVSVDGVFGIELLSLGVSPSHRHHFSFLTPISLPEGREVLSRLFQLFRKRPDPTIPSTQALAPSLTGTPLFKYLQECEVRFAVSPEES